MQKRDKKTEMWDERDKKYREKMGHEGKKDKQDKGHREKKNVKNYTNNFSIQRALLFIALNDESLQLALFSHFEINMQAY